MLFVARGAWFSAVCDGREKRRANSPIQSWCTDTLSLSSRSSDSDLVKRILEQKPGGEKILAKYAMTGEMKDRARRDLVSIVVAEMFEKYGRGLAQIIGFPMCWLYYTFIPQTPMDKRAQYALGIVTLFPSLKDPYSKKGYLSTYLKEHFFDIDSNEGYIAQKIKNTQRELSNGGTNGGRRRSSHTTGSNGPNLEREVTTVQQLEGDQCQTFQHRQKLIHDPEQCSTVLTVFPRFLDTKGLVAQDFDLLFGAETSSKLLEKWDFLKAKVIEQAKDISKTPLLDHLIQSAEENTEDDEVPVMSQPSGALWSKPAEADSRVKDLRAKLLNYRVMMFRCFVCKSSFVIVQMLIRHLKVFHAFYPAFRSTLVQTSGGSPTSW
ncbi:unnamed protein product [Leuciscus chuanchicus]